MSNTTVSAHFSGEDKPYTFLCPLDLALTLSFGDIVVAHPANGLKIARILEVHETSQATGPYNYKWVFQKVNMGYLTELETCSEVKEVYSAAEEAEAIGAALDKLKVDEPEEDLKKEVAPVRVNPTVPKMKIPHVPKL